MRLDDLLYPAMQLPPNADAQEESMRVLLIGPPGAGKGTQGAIIARYFGIPHIATGNLLRDHVARRTALGQSVRDHLDRGELVPDEVVLGMVRCAFIEAQVTGVSGYVLDGMPRTIEQAWAAYRMGEELGMTAEVAIHLKLSDAEVTRRLGARAVHEGRTDDTPQAIGTRLALYHERTHPVATWYAERGILISLDASKPVPHVATDILVALERVQSRPFALAKSCLGNDTRLDTPSPLAARSGRCSCGR